MSARHNLPGREFFKIAGIVAVLAFTLRACTQAPRVVAPTLAPSAAAPALRPTSIPTIAPQEDKSAVGVSEQDAATLGSLKKVDDYPLYTMHYRGSYDQRASHSGSVQGLASANPFKPDPGELLHPWGCSLFAALGDPTHMHYGRNFDWEYSPAVLLFTDPPDGYASVSMVDIAYLEFGGTRARTLTDLPLVERRALLRAPFLPFDGMNERGLAVGMAAVPPGEVKPDPNKETVGSLMVIRKMLDHAGDVDEAVAILQSYNISMEGGPPIHYLIADRAGRAALVEFYQDKTIIISNEKPWHQATNFLQSAVGGSVEGQCWRYDTIYRRLAQAGGQITARDALGLLADVSQKNTQWSIVYGMTSGDVSVTMGRGYSNVHTFHLDLTERTIP